MVERGQASKWFVLYRQANSLNHSRLGIIAGKRVMPTAVARNRAKRLIRETFRRLFPPHLGIDLVVLVRRPVTAETMAECRLALEKLLNNAQPVRQVHAAEEGGAECAKA